MPVKFSTLPEKTLSNSSYIVGLYNDSTVTTTGKNNCIISMNQFAKSSDITTLTKTVSDNDGKTVHLAGTETITGNKTFNGTNTFTGNNTFTSEVKQKSLTGDSTTTPSSAIYQTGYKLNDKNDVLVGFIQEIYQTTGNLQTNLTVSRNISGTAKYGSIGVGMDTSGTVYTYAPTPSTSDNSTKIATTAYTINLLKLIYPVGSIYIGTQSTCPLSTLFGTWSLVESNRALWTGTGSNGNTKIAAGLPNITGHFDGNTDDGGGAYKTGCFYVGSSVSGCNGSGTGGFIEFDASRCSSIYGNSTTVQPPAYVVNVWRRTA